MSLRIVVLVLFVAAPVGEAYAQVAKPPSKLALRKLRRRFEREPSVRQVQTAALRFFKVHPDRVASYRAGAAWKALMPELEGNFNFTKADGFRRLQDQLYAQSTNTALQFAKDLEYTDNNSYSIGVRAHWYLDRLIFNAEVLDVASLVGVQEGLLREITSLYFTRRRLLTIFALNPPKDPGEQITESIRLDEITANLDALTGGYFTRKIRAAGLR